MERLIYTKDFLAKYLKKNIGNIFCYFHKFSVRGHVYLHFCTFNQFYDVCVVFFVCDNLFHFITKRKTLIGDALMKLESVVAKKQK